MLIIFTFLSMLIIETTSIGMNFLDPSRITPNNNGNVATTTQNIAGIVLAVAQVVGISVAVIMLIVLAIKYMSSAPNDRAEIKKHAVVYIVGAVILFAASGILGIIRGFAENLGGSGGNSRTALQTRINTVSEQLNQARQDGNQSEIDRLTNELQGLLEQLSVPGR